MFCRNCIKKVSNCPLCRKPVLQSEIFGIQSSKASKQEATGVAPLLKNDLDPEKASLVISLLKGLAFRAAVSTAQNARKWQELQREHWNQNELVSRVITERPNRG